MLFSSLLLTWQFNSFCFSREFLSFFVILFTVLPNSAQFFSFPSNFFLLGFWFFQLKPIFWCLQVQLLYPYLQWFLPKFLLLVLKFVVGETRFTVLATVFCLIHLIFVKTWFKIFLSFVLFLIAYKNTVVQLIVINYRLIFCQQDSHCRCPNFIFPNFFYVGRNRRKSLGFPSIRWTVQTHLSSIFFICWTGKFHFF